MDLIYMNENKEDIGTLSDYSFDLAYGYDENDFELKVNINNHVCLPGYIVYMEDTEYGGVIRRIRVNTATSELVYMGDTWHGILNRKVLMPDADEDYLICDGDANDVLATLITRMGLGDLYQAKSSVSGIDIDNYKMHRYIAGYDGIEKMLKSAGAKLKVTFYVSYEQVGYVILEAIPIIDYSTDDEFDSSQIDFDIEKNYMPVNHVICLGKGDLAEREVIHLYADLDGNISHTQSQTGLSEIVATYENANCESVDELEKGGKELLESYWNSDSLQVDFDSTKEYEIGDIVGAMENTTGIFMAKEIVKKIVTIKNNQINIEHKVGE